MMFILLFYLIRAILTYNFTGKKSTTARKEDDEDQRLTDKDTPSISDSKRPTRKRHRLDAFDSSVSNDITYPEEAVTSPDDLLTFATPKHAVAYNMNLEKRGKCVIFNQQCFNEGNGDFREGSDVDVKSITAIFEELDFEVTEHLNLSFCEVMEEIDILSKTNYNDCDCFCIFILTHGDRGDRVYARDVSYPLLNIWKPFTADICKSLAGKPKLFFIQACRGRQTEEGVQGRCATDSNETTYTIPTHADFLFGYSAVEGFYSWRNRNKGTWYIQCLCSVFAEYWRNTDLLRMMTMTARKVAFEYISQHDEENMNKKKQIPTLTSTLTRDLYFAPKHKS